VKVKEAPRRFPAPTQSAWALKWGIVLIALGLASMFAFGIESWVPAFIREDTAGAVFFMAGLGMVVHYAIARRREKKES
jgi:hypothetical protein